MAPALATASSSAWRRSPTADGRGRSRFDDGAALAGGGTHRFTRGAAWICDFGARFGAEAGAQLRFELGRYAFQARRGCRGW
jgi:hypothetical protein